MKGEKENDKKSVCRDFMRNVCKRGDSCKYFHPQEKYVFCHDYRNGKCFREECAFIHCSREDEDHYNQTGDLPPHLMELQSQRHSEIRHDVPICKDFLNGDCDRSMCKYRHLWPSGAQRQQPPQPQLLETFIGKRRRVEVNISHNFWTLEDENAFLRKSVADLSKRLDDLRATNEFLLEQNAQMRLQDKTQGLTAVTVPAAVTITNGQIQPQVNGAIRTVTASVATVPVSLAAVAAGTPVSIATVSMAPVIPATSVTVAHQDHHPQTTAGPLVSYPIVARPVLSNL